MPHYTLQGILWRIIFFPIIILLGATIFGTLAIICYDPAQFLPMLRDFEFSEIAWLAIAWFVLLIDILGKYIIPVAVAVSLLLVLLYLKERKRA